MDLQGAKVLLTGATGGIGQALAAELAARGGEVVRTGRRADVLGRGPSALRSTSGPRSPTLAAGFLGSGGPFMIVGEPGVARLEVLAGGERIPLPGPVAVLPAGRLGAADRLPDVVVAGFRADGQVVAPLST